MSYNKQASEKNSIINLRSLFLGLLFLAGLVLVVTHIGELENFVRLARQLQPQWLALALLLQFTTYISGALVWYIGLHFAGSNYSLSSLIPLGIAKLFTDQAMPSGGVSGIAFLIAALNRRGIPTNLCLAILLLSLVTYYTSYLLAALATFVLLYFYHALHLWIVLIIIVFSFVAIGIPASALWLQTLGNKKLPEKLLKILPLNNIKNAIADAPDDLLRSPTLIIKTTLLHGSVFVLDSATLWVILLALSTKVSFAAVFPAFVMASLVATLGPIPLGLGTFEVTCVSMLRVLGVPIEAALTSTLLLRGFTLWLPMLPGMWLARHALR